MDPIALISKYYPINSDAYRILLSHSRNVADKAVSISRLHPELGLDETFLEEASMLHDIGIFLCNAPMIGCYGDADYVCHGYLGAELLRKEGYPRHALVCERHTGTGFTMEDIEQQQLPIPAHDMMPVTIEEQVISLADKFFSKIRLNEVKTPEQVRRQLYRHGEATVLRFDEWCKRFLAK